MVLRTAQGSLQNLQPRGGGSAQWEFLALRPAEAVDQLHSAACIPDQVRQCLCKRNGAREGLPRGQDAPALSPVHEQFMVGPCQTTETEPVYPERKFSP